MSRRHFDFIIRNAILMGLATSLLAGSMAYAADPQGTAPYYDRKLGVVVHPPAAAVVAPPPARREVDVIGSPPLPYKGFEYPLDDASWFNPPHPAAQNQHLMPAPAGRRVIVVPHATHPPVATQVHSSLAHRNWCETRYHSYRATDNTFLPPRGSRRVCVSPFN